MIRPPLFLAAVLLAATAAVAEPTRPIPIERDLQKLERSDERLERIEERRPDVTGSTSLARPNPFYLGRDPSGVVGFSGPPDIYGSTVGSYAPLPPGAPGNEY